HLHYLPPPFYISKTLGFWKGQFRDSNRDRSNPSDSVVEARVLALETDNNDDHIARENRQNHHGQNKITIV
uniref:Uncharacterized protein n=1 Tax=Romanomermis culicivorax TaxID=13658 RepID=A0A915HVG5_ROMCU